MSGNLNTGNSLMFQAAIPGTTSAVRYSATDLPVGLTIDPQSGIITGTVLESGHGTFRVTATDMDQVSVSIAVTYTVTTEVTESDTSVTTVLNCDMQYRNMITDVDSTAATIPNYLEGILLLTKLSRAAIATTDTTACDVLWHLHTDFKDSLFTEANFFNSLDHLDRQDFILLSTVYNVFRAAVTNPKDPVDLGPVTRLNNNPTIADYIHAKTGWPL